MLNASWCRYLPLHSQPKGPPTATKAHKSIICLMDFESAAEGKWAAAAAATSASTNATDFNLVDGCWLEFSCVWDSRCTCWSILNKYLLKPRLLRPIKRAQERRSTSSELRIKRLIWVEPRSGSLSGAPNTSRHTACCFFSNSGGWQSF